MGKRKKGKKKAPQKPLYLRAKLPTTFKCPFCCVEDAVDCRIKRTTKEAFLWCNSCPSKFSAEHVTQLMEPIDVYHLWLSELKRRKLGIFKEEDQKVVAPGGEELDYDVPDDDAWEEDEEKEDGDDEDADDDYEPPSKKRNADESDSDDEDVLAEDLRKVAEVVGKDADAKAILKEFTGSKDDGDDD